MASTAICSPRHGSPSCAGGRRAAPRAPPDVLGLLVASHGLASRRLAPGLGRLAPDSPADLVILGYDPPTPLSSDNLAGYLLFGLTARHVRDVIVAARVVVQDRVATRIDAAALHSHAREQAFRLWRRMSARRKRYGLCSPRTQRGLNPAPAGKGAG